MAQTEACARCGRPTEGYASIDEKRYCHADPHPTCYMLESWDRATARMDEWHLNVDPWVGQS